MPDGAPESQQVDLSKESRELACRVKALSDPSRVFILMLISTAAVPATGQSLHRALGIGQPTISHHLRILKAAGLVESVKDGNWTNYTISTAGAQALLDQLRTVLLPTNKEQRLRRAGLPS
jgi:ArsR family transcriptional regulator, arsenate/arsenite/antimonite-responsive transcriptional repressor